MKSLKQVQDQIEQYFNKDQQIRKNPKGTLKEMRDFEHQITIFLKEIIKDHGWPTISKFGKDASHKACIMVCHSNDQHFVNEFLDYMTIHLSDFDGPSFALIYDKVKLSQGLPQRYGTKIKSVFNQDGSLTTTVVTPLEDEENLDELRKSVGLGPIKEYLENSEKLFRQITDNGKNLKYE